MKYWEIIVEISTKPDGVTATSQRWIVTAAQSGSRKRIATESVIVRADEILTTFLELESMIRACGKLA